MGKNVAHHLCILVCQTAGIHIVASVLITLEVCGPNTSLAQLIKFVVFPDTSKSDSIINFRNLAQSFTGIFCYEQDSVGKLTCHE